MHLNCLLESWLDRIDHRVTALVEGEDDIIRYKGEVFKIHGMSHQGTREIYHPYTREVVGKVGPEQDINIWGHGVPEAEHAKKQRAYIPPVTGYELTWDDHTTGKRTGRFYPLGFPEENIKKLEAAYRRKGLGPVLKQARGKSRWPEAKLPPGVEKQQPQKKRDRVHVTDKMTVTPEQYAQLAKVLGVSQSELDALRKSGAIEVQ